MEPNLLRYIWRNSRAEQIRILFLVIVSLPFYYISLNLPKDIVNRGIQGRGFDGPMDTETFGAIPVPFSERIFGESRMLFEGFSLEQWQLLMALSLTFLGLVCVNGLFKLVVNTAKGRLGERMLRRLRYELADHLLRFRQSQLKRMKSAEVATMVKDEVEPLGGFIGDAFVTPVFLGGQAMTAMAFILVQSLPLGLVALAILVVQAVLIPKLRVKLLLLGKERQLTARQLAGRISEMMDGSVEVHTNDTSNFERAELTSRLGKIFEIRFEIYKRKFAIKFLNNFLSQVTPFVFYAGGGLLAIYGYMDIGALVAVIAAYKDLPGPVRDLINWEQQRQDVRIKYEQVIEQFQSTDIMEPALQDPDVPVAPLEGNISANSLVYTDENGDRLVDGVSFEFPLDSHVALVGDASSGKDQVALMLVGLVAPTAGHLAIGGKDLTRLPESALGRRMGYAGPDAYLFPQSVRENLVYGLRHRPIDEPVYPESEAAVHKWRADEAARSGNCLLDVNAEWVDRISAGAQDEESLDRSLIQAVSVVDMEEDIYRFGLNGSIDPEQRPGVAQDLLRARVALTERLREVGADSFVVRFDADKYNPNATMAENLLFGTPKSADFDVDAMADNPIVLRALDEAELMDDLVQKGFTIAQTMVELFADLPPGHPFFEQFSFIDADDLPEFRQLIQRAEARGVAGLGDDDRRRLLRLPFRYIEARHRLDLIDETLEREVVTARKLIAAAVERECPDAVEFFDPASYNAAASMMDNILFGRLVFGQAEAQETVGRAVTEVLREMDLREAVCRVGLDFQVGVGGKRLNATQRQKLAIARALIKRPDVLVINEATAVMDGATRARLIHTVLGYREGAGVVWVLERAAMADRFDDVIVLRQGRLMERGKYDDLARDGTTLPQLVDAD
mgnify:CR=1 FL=1